jgi:hypothetical protein
VSKLRKYQEPAGKRKKREVERMTQVELETYIQRTPDKRLLLELFMILRAGQSGIAD